MINIIISNYNVIINYDNNNNNNNNEYVNVCFASIMF